MTDINDVVKLMEDLKKETESKTEAQIRNELHELKKVAKPLVRALLERARKR